MSHIYKVPTAIAIEFYLKDTKSAIERGVDDEWGANGEGDKIVQNEKQQRKHRIEILAHDVCDYDEDSGQ